MPAGFGESDYSLSYVNGATKSPFVLDLSQSTWELITSQIAGRILLQQQGIKHEKVWRARRVLCNKITHVVRVKQHCPVRTYSRGRRNSRPKSRISPADS